MRSSLFLPTFDEDQLSNNALMNFDAMKPHQRQVLIHGKMNSKEVIDHSKTSFVRFVPETLDAVRKLIL